ncbi:MAG: hypothetical protein WBA17_07185 [Saprospiraceae bacterium]
MDKNELLQNGLLEQYVLGLTDPQVTRQIDVMMEQHREVSDQVASLRGRLHNYSEANRIPPPEGNPRELRSADDFYALDVEMVDRITDQNQRLHRWRWVSYLLLFGLAVGLGYGFLKYRSAHRETAAEQARYAQEMRAAEQERLRLQSSTFLPLTNEHEAHTIALSGDTLYAIFTPNHRRILFNTTDLGTLPSGHHYRVWLAPKVDPSPRDFSLGLELKDPNELRLQVSDLPPGTKVIVIDEAAGDAAMGPELARIVL